MLYSSYNDRLPTSTRYRICYEWGISRLQYAQICSFYEELSVYFEHDDILDGESPTILDFLQNGLRRSVARARLLPLSVFVEANWLRGLDMRKNKRTEILAMTRVDFSSMEIESIDVSH